MFESSESVERAPAVAVASTIAGRVEVGKGKSASRGHINGDALWLVSTSGRLASLNGNHFQRPRAHAAVRLLVQREQRPGGGQLQARRLRLLRAHHRRFL